MQKSFIAIVIVAIALCCIKPWSIAAEDHSTVNVGKVELWIQIIQRDLKKIKEQQILCDIALEIQQMKKALISPWGGKEQAEYEEQVSIIQEKKLALQNEEQVLNNGLQEGRRLLYMLRNREE